MDRPALPHRPAGLRRALRRGLIRPAAITTARLTLTPLTPDDATEMVGVLSDRALYRYTGGETPPTLAELRSRYEAQSAGPPPPSADRWLNWIVRLDGVAIGYVQATVTGAEASIAWVIGTAHQSLGYATEAAAAMVAWLAADGVTAVKAFIHRRNRPSQIVAERLGLSKQPGHPFDGEDLWSR